MRGIPGLPLWHPTSRAVPFVADTIAKTPTVGPARPDPPRVTHAIPGMSPQLNSTLQIQSFCAQAALFLLPLPAIKYTETSLTLADVFLIPAILLNFGHALKLHAFQIPFLLAATQPAVAHAGPRWHADSNAADYLSVGLSGSFRLVRLRESATTADRLLAVDR